MKPTNGSLTQDLLLRKYHEIDQNRETLTAKPSTNAIDTGIRDGG